jgi:hypothetical protein
MGSHYIQQIKIKLAIWDNNQMKEILKLRVILSLIPMNIQARIHPLTME